MWTDEAGAPAKQINGTPGFLWQQEDGFTQGNWAVVRVAQARVYSPGRAIPLCPPGHAGLPAKISNPGGTLPQPTPRALPPVNSCLSAARVKEIASGAIMAYPESGNELARIHNALPILNVEFDTRARQGLVSGYGFHPGDALPASEGDHLVWTNTEGRSPTVNPAGLWRAVPNFVSGSYGLFLARDIASFTSEGRTIKVCEGFGALPDDVWKLPALATSLQASISTHSVEPTVVRTISEIADDPDFLRLDGDTIVYGGGP